MALVAVCSAKGSPGVSTLAVALAALWPTTAVLADVDPAGSDLLWRYRDEDGNALDPDRSVLSLGAAVRHGGTRSRLDAHSQVLLGGLPVVAGFANPEQVVGLGPVWQSLADAFARWPDDVVVDCGRVVPGSPTMPVLARADAVLVVTRRGPAEFAQLRERLRGLTSALRLGQPGGVPTGVVLVSPTGDTGSAGELQRLLEAGRVAAPVVGHVALDEKGADALNGNWNHRVGRSLLVRSVRGLVPAVESLIQARRAA